MPATNAKQWSRKPVHVKPEPFNPTTFMIPVNNQMVSWDMAPAGQTAKATVNYIDEWAIHPIYPNTHWNPF